MVTKQPMPTKTFAAIKLSFASIVACFLLSGCATTTVKTTDVVPVIQQQQEIAEALLLDIGVAVFDPNNTEALDTVDEENIVFPQVRNAEAKYIPRLLTQTLQSSAGWGAVRVIPDENTNVDVVVTGKILHSDGETMSIEVMATDATGKHWFSKQYKAMASRYAYDLQQQNTQDAFQNIYNEVSNDLMKYKKQLSDAEILNIRQVAELKFAKSFAPETFGDHLDQKENGLLEVKRLPADNDPMMARIRQIRERDYLFIDTMQEYYTTFANSMERPYWQWRQESYQEVLALQKMQRSARDRLAIGAATLVAGIFGVAKGSSTLARTAGSVAMAGGGYVIKSGLEKGSESKMHIEALQELGDSLEASIAPHVIELEDRTVTLSGTVSNQYQQWRDILQEIYRIDTGTIENKTEQ